MSDDKKPTFKLWTEIEEHDPVTDEYTDCDGPESIASFENVDDARRLEDVLVEAGQKALQVDLNTPHVVVLLPAELATAIQRRAKEYDAFLDEHMGEDRSGEVADQARFDEDRYTLCLDLASDAQSVARQLQNQVADPPDERHQRQYVCHTGIPEIDQLGFEECRTILVKLYGLAFLDEDGGREFWNPDKDLDSDHLGEIINALPQLKESLEQDSPA